MGNPEVNKQSNKPADPNRSPANVDRAAKKKQLQDRGNEVGKSFAGVFEYFQGAIDESLQEFFKNMMESGVLSNQNEAALRKVLGLQPHENINAVISKVADQVSEKITDKLKVNDDLQVKKLDAINNSLNQLIQKDDTANVVKELRSISSGMKDNQKINENLERLIHTIEANNKSIQDMQQKMPEYLKTGIAGALANMNIEAKTTFTFNA